MGSHSEDSLETTTMYKLLIASVLAVATSLPIEDTAEVAAAKEVFNAAFAAAEAGEHGNLRPVNDDAQAAQIATSYIADSEDVAAAKAAFQAAFDDAAAGGLAAKQAPAPVHVILEPAPLAVAPAPVMAAAPVEAAALIEEAAPVEAAPPVETAALIETAAPVEAAAPVVAAAPVLATHPYAAGFPIHGL